MELENYEEYEIEYQDNDSAVDNEYTDISFDVQEQSETVLEEIEDTDVVFTDVTSDSSSVDISVESDTSEVELENLLRDYLSTRSVASESSSESSSGESSTGSSEETLIDYTDILNDLYDVTSDNASFCSSIYDYLEEYDTNNNLQSDVNDISLSNTLLLFVFIGILFGSVIDFGRRIF